MHLFFGSFLPPSADVFSYAFSKDEMLNICKESLSMLFTEYDDYFDQLTVNFCKSIYRIVGKKFKTAEKVPLKLIERSFAKANDQDSKMLSLLFGTCGLMSLESGVDLLTTILNSGSARESS